MVFRQWAVVFRQWAVMFRHCDVMFRHWAVVFRHWVVVFRQWAVVLRQWAVVFRQWAADFLASWKTIIISLHYMQLGTTCVVALLKGLEILSCLQHVQSGSGAHPASFSMGTVALPWGKAEGASTTALLYLASRFRMNGAILQRPAYAFVVKTGKTLAFHFIL